MITIKNHILKSLILLVLLITFSSNQFLLGVKAKDTLKKEEVKDTKVKVEEEVSTDTEVKEIEPTDEELGKEISTKWTESIRFKDFYLSKETLELKDKLKEYIVTLEKIYKETPEVFSSAILYGLILLDSGDLDRAEKVWEKAVIDFRSNPTPKVYRGWVHACKGNYQAAQELWAPIVKEKYDLGITGYGAGIWLPYHVDAVLGLYLMKDFIEGKDKEELIKMVEIVTKQFEATPKFAAARIANYLREGKLKLVARKLSNVLQAHPNDPTIITLLGITQLLTEHYDEAIELLNSSNKIYPYSPTNNLMRARALFALNNKKESFEAVEKALKLDPNIIPAKVKKDKVLAAKSYIIPANKDSKKKNSEKKALVPEEM